MIEGNTRQTGKLRKVVYTCVTAGYSVVPVHPQRGWDYVCFSEERIDVAGWRMQPIPADAFVVEHDLRPDDKAKTSKCIKLLPHRFLPGYDVSIWIDATLAFRRNVDLDALLDRFLASGRPFQVRAHPYRRCTYDEALQVHRNAKDTAANVLRLVEYLKQNRFPRNLGLTENNFLLRLHHDARVIRFSERWWQLVQEFSRRDQLTFMFAAWREGLDVDIIDDRVDPSLERSSDGEARGAFFDATFEMHREVVPPFRRARSARWYLRYYRARIAETLLFANNRAGDLAWSACEYRQRFGRWPNLVAPRTLTETLLRTRVFGDARDIERARISDKEWAKHFIARRVGDNLVVP
ncbi:MAG TPA: glycosyltransferase domain-containing protein, partial [Casimicrobiaceae bacterium]|nr:glycosyltransferase domain-containing protein [Casimicrobiaceae bacterium]